MQRFDCSHFAMRRGTRAEIGSREVKELRTGSMQRRYRRLLSPSIGLLLAMLTAVPPGGTAEAQAPPEDTVLVNADRQFVERKKNGEFVARPVFDRQIETLYYGVRDADTGDWISSVFRVMGGEKRLSDGWEYSWQYPSLDGQPDLDPDRAYLLVMLPIQDGRPTPFNAVIPVYEPSRIWDRILAALQPARWARAIAGWAIEGTHGTLCGVVERATGDDADNCRGG